jgi:hypothetical protein
VNWWEMTWPKQTGKAIIQRVLRDAQLREGGHVHTVGARDGEMCQGGDSECPLFAIQLQEAMEAWQG